MKFVVAANNEEILQKNIIESPEYSESDFIIQRGYTNVPKAYNEAMDCCDTGLICFLHQDVYLPEGWTKHLKSQISNIKLQIDDWGVLGVAGVALRDGGKLYLGHVRDRGCEWGTVEGLPTEVDTLDELLLIIKNDGRLRFDEGVGNHFYGADICTQARLQGRKCYAVDAYCHHNSIHGGELLPDFWQSFQYMKNKYKNHLPIGTTCTVVQ